MLHDCKTESLALRKELRQTFGHKGDENGEWRRVQNEELHSLYRPPIIVTVIKYRRSDGQIV